MSPEIRNVLCKFPSNHQAHSVKKRLLQEKISIELRQKAVKRKWWRE